MHYWGDEWEHWEKLYKVISFIEDYWRTRGRINTAGCKEKYGTFRDYSEFWDGTVLSLIKPYRNGYYKYWIDRCVIKTITKYTGIRWLFRRYQYWIYNRGINIAVANYPEIKDELLSDLYHYKLLKGPEVYSDVEHRYWVTDSKEN